VVITAVSIVAAIRNVDRAMADDQGAALILKGRVERQTIGAEGFTDVDRPSRRGAASTTGVPVTPSGSMFPHGRSFLATGVPRNFF
jgi:hypothetical protein